MSSLPHGRSLFTRRRFLAGGVLTAAALGIYAGEIERHMLTTVRKTVRIRNLPTAFHGFRIAQLSDIHFRRYDEPFFVEHAVNVLNRLQPDMVALTGDFITSRSGEHLRDELKICRDEMEACATILSRIQCPLRFCSLGNHDVSLERTAKQILVKYGLSLLQNEFTAIDLRGDRLWVSGIADAYFGVPNLGMAIPPPHPDQPVILLGHEPDFADIVAQQARVDLMLAGHTHGGQVRIPFMPAILLPSMGYNYVEGLFHLAGGTQLYVNRGLGCMHIPFRFNCPPELTELTLQPA